MLCYGLLTHLPQSPRTSKAWEQAQEDPLERQMTCLFLAGGATEGRRWKRCKGPQGNTEDHLAAGTQRSPRVESSPGLETIELTDLAPVIPCELGSACNIVFCILI